jgi:hypothetical protein
MQVLAAPRPVFRFLIPAFILYVIIATAYNYFYLRRFKTYNAWTLIRAALFLFGWFGLYFIIPSFFWRGVFLLSGVPLIYFVERVLGHPGEQLLFNETLITAFAGIMAIVGLSHYFPFSGTWYLLALFLFVSITVRASYEFTPQSRQAKWTSAIILGLVMAEILWVAGFLPFHFSAIALLVFNAFYCAWTLGYNYLYNHLTPKKVQFQVILALAFTVLIVIVTPWKILS